MNKIPKISIVTPTYNRAKYLEKTILSVLDQGYPNLEYIIIDGGSTDGTVEIIKKYEKHLAYWESVPDEGMYHALQKGFQRSTGDIMAWINSDDLYHRGAFDIVSNIFETLTDVYWLTGIPTFYNKEGNCVAVSPTRKWSYSRFAISDYKWIQQESVFWKRELWVSAGARIDHHYKFAADFELWCRFFSHSQLWPVNTVLGGFRLHGDQMSINEKTNYENEAREIHNKINWEDSGRMIPAKFLRSLSELLGTPDTKVLNYLATRTQNMGDMLHQFPKTIYYDFTSNLWKK